MSPKLNHSELVTGMTGIAKLVQPRIPPRLSCSFHTGARRTRTMA
ncbi:Hypothetical protein A7982_02338 [Minicystis rosea]|nr:Hypothetical protein A7982_02338 [Minicystis rosea]